MGESDAGTEALTDYGLVLWRGRPSPRAFFTTWDLFYVPFSLCGLGIVIAAALGALRAGAPIPTYFVMAFMGGFAVYLVGGRFITKRRTNRRTTYVITDTHAIIERSGRFEARLLEPAFIRLRRHVFGDLIDADFEWRSPEIGGRRRSTYVSYANTGLDFFIPMGTGGWIPFRFYDVDDPSGLREALRRAGVELQDRGTVVGA